jgi:hypothetical protein
MFHARLAGGGDEVRLNVEHGGVGGGDQHGAFHALQGTGQGFGLRHVAFDDLDLRQRRQLAGIAGVAHQCTHGNAALRQSAYELSSVQSGGAGHENHRSSPFALCGGRSNVKQGVA